MIGGGGLALHHDAQNSVNARLVAPAVALEPIEYVRIETDRQLPLGGRPRRRGLLEKRLVEWRNVRIVNIGFAHAVNPCQVALDRFFVHVGSPSSWR